MRSARSIAVAALCIGATSGCYAHWDVPHSELYGLNGWKAPGRVAIKDVRNRRFHFDEHTAIEVSPGKDPPAEPVRLESATVVNGTFEGKVAEG